MPARSWSLPVALLLLAGCASPPAPEPSEARPGGEAGGPGGAVATWPALADARIRPGVRITPESPLGVQTGLSGCTANFLFASPGNTTLYIGTAGHCAGGLKAGDPTPVADGLATATLAYCSRTVRGEPCPAQVTGSGPDDFALFALKPEDRPRAHPAVLHWGGPRGLAECSKAAAGAQLVAFGNSSAKPSEAAKPMVGNVVAQRGDGSVMVRFLPPGIPADSGSPVLTAAGEAFGLVRSLAADGTNNVACLDSVLALQAKVGPPVQLVPWNG